MNPEKTIIQLFRLLENAKNALMEASVSFGRAQRGSSDAYDKAEIERNKCLAEYNQALNNLREYVERPQTVY